MKASKIEWTRSTFNPWWGCERVSPGCTHCYAEAFAKRTGHDVWGGTSPRRLFPDKHWNEPRRWNEEAAKTGERWRVFCASMADVFEDRLDLDEPRARLFRLVEETPALTWLLLTKRPENMIALAPESWRERWPVNAWAGTTVEDAERKARIDVLRTVPSSTLWLSIEPQVEDLGEVNLRGIAWAIIGGESGPGARPFRLAWARDLIRQMREQGVAPHVKQLGLRPHSPEDRITHRGSTLPTPQGFSRHLNDAKGADWSEWPEDLRVREYPATRLVHPREA